MADEKQREMRADERSATANKKGEAGVLKTIIIDDDPEVVARMVRVLAQMDGVTVCATAGSCADGAAIILEHDPQLVFLDVQLPDGTAFDMLSKLGTLDCHVIFVTAYEQYAIDAIKNSATDYLLKPFGSEDITMAVAKVVSKEAERVETMRARESPAQTLRFTNPRIGLHDRSGTHFFDLHEIVRCKADGNYTEFHLICGRRLVVTALIKEYEQVLCSHGFFRVNRSQIVNMAHVVRFVNTGSGTIFTSDAAEIDISRRRKAEFIQALNEMGVVGGILKC